MKIIPWTVNETEQMKKLVRFGVDGIITDYPNRIPQSSN
jgi:glycerophosphoryl diester phosphodiesterase